MNISDFTSGQLVRVDVKTENISGSFDATVSMTYKNLLLLDPIYYEGRLVGFPKDCSANLTVTSQSTFFVWSDVKIRTVVFKGHNYHAVELFGDAETINRRSNYRVPIGQDMNVSTFTDRGPEAHTVYIKDISETGFAFISNDMLSVGRMVRLSIPTSPKTHLSLSAKIVRTSPMGRVGETLYGCHFSERNKNLAAYLMTRQRDDQKRRLGANVSTTSASTLPHSRFTH